MKPFGMAVVPMFLAAIVSTAEAGIIIDGPGREPPKPVGYPVVYKAKSDNGVDSTGTGRLAEQIPAMPRASGLLPPRPPKGNESALESLALQLQAAMGTESDYALWLMDLEAAERVLKSPGGTPSLYGNPQHRMPELSKAPLQDPLAMEVKRRIRDLASLIPTWEARDDTYAWEAAWKEAGVLVTNEVKRSRAYLSDTRTKLGSLESSISRAMKLSSPEKLSVIFDEYQKSVGELLRQEAEVVANLADLQEKERTVQSKLESGQLALSTVQADLAAAEGKLNAGVANLDKIFETLRGLDHFGQKFAELKGMAVLSALPRNEVIQGLILAEMMKINSMAAVIQTEAARLSPSVNIILTFHVVAWQPIKRWGFYTSGYRIKGIVTSRIEGQSRVMSFDNGPLIDVVVAKGGQILKGESLFSEGFRLWSEMSSALPIMVNADQGAQEALAQLYTKQPDVLTQPLGVQDQAACVEVIRSAVRSKQAQ